MVRAARVSQSCAARWVWWTVALSKSNTFTARRPLTASHYFLELPTLRHDWARICPGRLGKSGLTAAFARADKGSMAMWIIGGGAVLAAWAMLSVVGGELTRRTGDLHHRIRERRETEAAADDDDSDGHNRPGLLQLR